MTCTVKTGAPCGHEPLAVPPDPLFFVELCSVTTLAPSIRRRRSSVRATVDWFTAQPVIVKVGTLPGGVADATALAPTANFGPYNVTFLEGGVGLARPLSEAAAPIASGAPWSITGWLRSARRQSGEVIVAAIGDVAGGEWRGLTLVDGALSFVVGRAVTVRSAAAA